MKYIYFLLLLIFVMTGCFQPDRTGEDLEHLKEVNLIERPPAEIAFSISPLEVNEYSFIEVSGWFDEEHILFLTDESGTSKVYKHHIYSGDTELFFEHHDPILQMDASFDYEYFSIQKVALTDQSDILFINRQGDIVYSWENEGVAFDVFWNPYANGRLLITEMDGDFQSSIHEVNLTEGSINTHEDTPYYLQWLGENQLSYLAWDDYSLGFSAPIKSWSLNGDNEGASVIQRDVITYFGLFDEKYVTVRADEDDNDLSVFEVYQYDDLEPLISWKTNTLNTYSSEWWIPSFTYTKDHFYFLDPIETGDIFDYEAGFHLKSVNLMNGKIMKIVEDIEELVPLKVSPDGYWVLKGNQLEHVVSTSTGAKWDLLW
ncbi:hypothetical protein LGQ02_07345 [Bacillus shivajii]|uniref:YqgU-like beta propeller domain-containing protein n=1 Tax=Bacillus shivajii TaxID=1983719 RepID=UPI001CFAFA2D|nr:hypothetical protein [Bacillus shivajii]UCZ54562.1 hypothetical protein LGQ02_07345 [Bacillus shivajii]